MSYWSFVNQRLTVALNAWSLIMKARTRTVNLWLVGDQLVINLQWTDGLTMANNGEWLIDEEFTKLIMMVGNSSSTMRITGYSSGLINDWQLIMTINAGSTMVNVETQWWWLADVSREWWPILVNDGWRLAMIATKNGWQWQPWWPMVPTETGNHCIMAITHRQVATVLPGPQQAPNGGEIWRINKLQLFDYEITGYLLTILNHLILPSSTNYLTTNHEIHHPVVMVFISFADPRNPMVNCWNRRGLQAVFNHRFEPTNFSDQSVLTRERGHNQAVLYIWLLMVHE